MQSNLNHHIRFSWLPLKKMVYMSVWNENLSTKALPELNSDNYAPQHCAKLVQKNDHENFLCTLLMKGDERRDAFALRAFNVEVANCNNKISEDSIAKLRLKFWHDSIDKCFLRNKSYVEGHPVLRELQNTIKRHNLSKLYLKRLVTARDRPPNQQFSTLAEMENYADQTFSSLLHLLVECHNVKDIHVDHAISHLGKAQGLTTLLRAIPYKGRHEALNVPQELLIKYGVSQERILRHAYSDKPVEECIYDIASTAFSHLERARSLQNKVPPSVRKVFLPAVSVERYLERLRKANFKLSDKSCLERDNLLPMSLYWHGFRGKY